MTQSMTQENQELSAAELALVAGGYTGTLARSYTGTSAGSYTGTSTYSGNSRPGS